MVGAEWAKVRTLKSANAPAIPGLSPRILALGPNPRASVRNLGPVA
jgi:hypothetical protein